MHYVTVEGLTKSYGINPLFKNITFHINEGEKIALIARNGVGKSTLLRILAGQEVQESGKVHISKGVSVALFEQDPKFDEDKTVLENIFTSNHPIMSVMRQYEAALDADDAEMITECIGKIDELGAWDYEAKVHQILGKLNIHHLQNKVSSLSGGQRKRAALAKTLIDIGFEHQHTLLMMDEPTNHLDVGMIEWLEHYLGSENITLLLVTHDRYFLDAVCTEIWELERENIYTYVGDYENYMEKKAARIESELASIDKAKNQYRKELEWMRKQPKARSTKSRSRQDNFYEVEARAKQKIEDAQVQLQVKMSRIGGKVLEVKKVYKSFGDLPILKGFDYTFSKGERIGVIGKNGVGKSTFLNILQGIEKPDSGKINVGDTIIFGNFSQQGLKIKENLRVIEYVKTFAENFPLADGSSLSAAQFLELFLFTPEKQYTYLNSLSGGEKKRLQLLTILFTNPNFLILDEPTNDLDWLVDHLFVFEGNGEVRDFPGNYTQYRLEEKEKEKRGSSLNAKPEPVVAKVVETPKPVEKQGRKLSFKEKQELENIEKAIATLEAEKVTIADKMSDGDLPFEEIKKLSDRLIAIDNELGMKEFRWLELSEGA